MVGAALAWFAGSLVGGAVFLHRGPLVHLHLAYPTGHLRRPLATATVVVAYVACIFEALAANSWLTLGLAGLVVLAAGDLFVRSSGPARKAGGPALAAAVAFAGVLALGSANRLLKWDADLAVLLGYYVVICLVSVVLLRDLLWGRWTDATLADLVTDLGGRSSTEGLNGLLQRAVGDPSLVVGYWLADEQRYVDDSGNPLALPAVGNNRAVTRIEDDGVQLAILVHDTVLLADSRLIDGVAEAARLAVANARMQAELRADAVELAASRRRIVEAADVERRRLQGELANGAERRLARAAELLDLWTASGEEDPDLVELRHVRSEIRGVRGDLHQFAQGVSPAALARGGLRTALPALLARIALPVDLTVEVSRMAPPVESALFFVCSEALTNVTKHANATHASVHVRSEPGMVVATVIDDGTGGADPSGSGLRGLADRLQALGGSLEVTRAEHGGTRLTARVPPGTPSELEGSR